MIFQIKQLLPKKDEISLNLLSNKNLITKIKKL